MKFWIFLFSLLICSSDIFEMRGDSNEEDILRYFDSSTVNFVHEVSLTLIAKNGEFDTVKGEFEKYKNRMKESTENDIYLYDIILGEKPFMIDGRYWHSYYFNVGSEDSIKLSCFKHKGEIYLVVSDIKERGKVKSFYVLDYDKEFKNGNILCCGRQLFFKCEFVDTDEVWPSLIDYITYLVYFAHEEENKGICRSCKRCGYKNWLKRVKETLNKVKITGVKEFFDNLDKERNHIATLSDCGDVTVSVGLEKYIDYWNEKGHIPVTNDGKYNVEYIDSILKKY